MDQNIQKNRNLCYNEGNGLFKYLITHTLLIYANCLGREEQHKSRIQRKRILERKSSAGWRGVTL